MMVMIVTIVLMILIQIVIKKTKLGKSIRAVSSGPGCGAADGRQCG